VALAILGWGLCVYGVPRLPAPAAVVYGAVAIALFTWAAINGTADVQAAVRMDLLLLVMALCSGVLLSGGLKLPLPERPAFVWGGIAVTLATLGALHQSGATAPVMILAGLALGAVQIFTKGKGASSCVEPVQI
jgi:hypothetical protein